MEDQRQFQPEHALRGGDRLTFPVALPYVDLFATTGYEGSISKVGDNADWDWCLYRDQNGEYVLFETDGAGCLYNLTQHRFPTSREPIFRVYLDGAETPALALRQSQFRELKAGGIYEGPAKGGQVPIWVIRNFTPMVFSTHCRVTSSVELKGCRREYGEGGWGHVTYALYDTAQGLTTYTGGEEHSLLEHALDHLGDDPKYAAENEATQLTDLAIAPGGSVTVLNRQGAGSVAALHLSLQGENAAPEVLQTLRFRMYWDGHDTADVDAPAGTLFGNEYGSTAGDLRTLMLGMRLEPGALLEAYHYYPMPYWHSARIELYNTGDRLLTVRSLEVQITPSGVVSYSGMAGYFTSSAYYEKTPNIRDRNSVIATVNGVGHMVYGVLSGYGINCGCEGDVRVFFDGRKSPEIESDGSESWASYGWGFETPPQSNAFSAYNGLYGGNTCWSEVRLTIGDSYHFRSSLRFELEHGCENDGMGAHSGQIFCYLLRTEAPVCRETDRLSVDSETSLRAHRYTVDGSFVREELCSSYANGLQREDHAGVLHTSFTGRVSFTVSIDPENIGVVLCRTSSQAQGRHAARLWVDGTRITERYWYYDDSNDICCWLDDSFQIPAAYTAGKRQVTITVEPFAADGERRTWNHASFTVYSLTAPIPIHGIGE